MRITIVFALIAVAAAGPLLLAGLPGDGRPDEAPETVRGSTWYRVARDLRGWVAPRELLGGPPRSPDLLEALAREGAAPGAFRRTAVQIRERAIRLRGPDADRGEVEELIHGVQLPVGVSTAPPSGTAAADPTDPETRLALDLLADLTTTMPDEEGF